MSEPSIQEEAKNKLINLKKLLPQAGGDVIHLAEFLAKDLGTQGAFSPALFILAYRSITLDIRSNRKDEDRKIGGKIFDKSVAVRWTDWTKKITETVFPESYAQEVLRLIRIADAKPTPGPA